MDCVQPHNTTKGAPPMSPTAWIHMRPPGVLRRSASAHQPPIGEPAMLASCTKMVAVNPEAARLKWNLSYRNRGIHESSTRATKFAQRNAAIRRIGVA